MKLLILLNILFSLWTKFNEIGVKNRIKEQAALAYTKKDYGTAITQYKKLLKQYHVNDEKVILNIAHSYFNTHDTASATFYYKRIINSISPKISSTANLQLGILEVNKQNYKTGLGYFKEALKHDPGNENARYNFELIYRLIQKNELAKPKEKNKKAQKKDEERQDNSNTNTAQPQSKKGNKAEQLNMEETSKQTNNVNLSGKGMFSFFNKKKEEIKNEQMPIENGNKESEVMVSNRLKKYHLNEAKAKALLEAMQEEEVQYIQQKKKYQQTDYNKNKPDY
jgi:Ca-activated chloride channel family protein